MTHLFRSDTASDAYYDLYLRQIGVDFTFSCANNEFVKAHKIILMASSSFFYEEFKTNKKSLNCLLPQVSADAVRLFLELVYRKKVNAISDVIEREVMNLADMFDVEYQEIEGETVSPDNHVRINPDRDETHRNNYNATNDSSLSESDANYIRQLKTMDFRVLESSCVICKKFYRNMLKHERKCHKFRKLPMWRCETCKLKFYWLDKKFHECKKIYDQTV